MVWLLGGKRGPLEVSVQEFKVRMGVFPHSLSAVWVHIEGWTVGFNHGCSSAKQMQ